MTRAQGFARGDFDTSFPIDDKMLHLRHTVDAATYYAAVGVYWHVVAAAWREAERRPASRTCPDATAYIDALMSTKLLDDDERLPKRAFESYVGRAKRSRSAASDRQARFRVQKSRVSHAVSRVTERESPLVTRESQSLLVRGSVGRGKDGTGEDEGGSGGDAAVALHHRLGTFPSQKMVDWLNQLAAEFGEDRLVAVIEATPADTSSPRDYVVAVRDALRAERHVATKREAVAEKARLEEWAQTHKLTPEQVADNQRAIAKLTAEWLGPKA